MTISLLEGLVMVPAVSAIYAALCALLLLVLSANVVRLRFRFQVGLGSGGQPVLGRAIRAQGNFIEYVPLTLLLLVLFELGGGVLWFIHLAGCALLAGRLLHPLGLARSSGRSMGRQAGMLLTWAAMLALALANLWLWFGPAGW